MARTELSKKYDAQRARQHIEHREIERAQHDSLGICFVDQC
jgi:hypothetical protein